MHQLIWLLCSWSSSLWLLNFQSSSHAYLWSSTCPFLRRWCFQLPSMVTEHGAVEMPDYLIWKGHLNVIDASTGQGVCVLHELLSMPGNEAHEPSSSPSSNSWWLSIQKCCHWWWGSPLQPHIYCPQVSVSSDAPCLSTCLTRGKSILRRWGVSWGLCQFEQWTPKCQKEWKACLPEMFLSKNWL